METAGAAGPAAPGAHGHQCGLRGDPEGGSVLAGALPPVLPAHRGAEAPRPPESTSCRCLARSSPLTTLWALGPHQLTRPCCHLPQPLPTLLTWSCWPPVSISAPRPRGAQATPRACPPGVCAGWADPVCASPASPCPFRLPGAFLRTCSLGVRNLHPVGLVFVCGCPRLALQGEWEAPHSVARPVFRPAALLHDAPVPGRDRREAQQCPLLHRLRG